MASVTDNISYLWSLFTKMMDGWDFKFFTGSLISVLGFLFDMVQKDALFALLVLIIIDFFSAIIAAYKTKNKIRSGKIFRTALKIIVYFSLISAGFLTEKAIPIDMLDELLIGFLVVTELVSIMENTALAGYATPKGLLKFLQDYKDKK